MERKKQKDFISLLITTHLFYLLILLKPVYSQEKVDKALVIKVNNPNAVKDYQIDTTVTRAMLEKGLEVYTNLLRVQTNWLSNRDIVGIKVYSLPGSITGTRPEVVESLVQILLSWGLSPTNIIIWDRYLKYLQEAGYQKLALKYGVILEGAVEAGFDPECFYDNPILGTIVWGDLGYEAGAFKQSRRSHVTTLLTKRVTKIINVAPLLNHNQAGVTGCIYSLVTGSVDNINRFLKDPDQLSIALPEILALPQIYDKLLFNVIDALIAQYYGGETMFLHYSLPIREIWISQDPVALDVLAIQRLKQMRQQLGMIEATIPYQIYKNAQLLRLGLADLEKIEIREAP